MSAIVKGKRCEPCSNGNHTGTNGTGGCTGRPCVCPCRERAAIDAARERIERSRMTNRRMIR